MQSDGQRRGNTTYFTQNLIPSTGNPPLGPADRTTAPTHSTTAALTPIMQNRLPPLLDLRESGDPTGTDFYSERQPFVEPFRQRSHSNSSSSSHSHCYSESSQRTLLPTIARARRQTTSFDLRSPCGISGMQPQQPDSGYTSSLDSSIPYPVGNHGHNNHRTDHLHRITTPHCGVYVPHITSARPQISQIPNNHISHSHNHSTTPGVCYSARPMTADDYLYHNPSPGYYHHETSHVPPPYASTDLTLTSRANVPFHVPQQDRTIPYIPPTSLSFVSSTSESPRETSYEPGTGPMMGLNVDNRPLTSATITTTLHMNVNVSADRRLGVGSTQSHSSSSNSMNNGIQLSSNPSFTTTPSPGSSWSRYSQQHSPVASASTSMSVSALGSALELKAQVTYTPPGHSHPQSSSEGMYHHHHHHQGEQQQSHPLVHIQPANAGGGGSGERHSFESGINVVGSKLESPHGLGENLRSGQSEDQNDQFPSARKKKRSKMHVCTVCGKEFPRPSGLTTHMNTHNNMKPYPCTFPGCERTFGVRSNAKRHLRTHGISPKSASLSTTSTGSTSTGSSSHAKKSSTSMKPQPYIVGFSEPVIVGEPMIGAGGGECLHPNSTEGRTGLNDRVGNGQSGRGGFRLPGYPGPSFFKLRWMPPSLTSKNHATALKSVGGMGSFDEDEDDEDDGGIGEDRDGIDWDDRTDRSGRSTLGSFSGVIIRKVGSRCESVDDVKEESDENGDRVPML